MVTMDKKIKMADTKYCATWRRKFLVNRLQAAFEFDMELRGIICVMTHYC